MASALGGGGSAGTTQVAVASSDFDQTFADTMNQRVMPTYAEQQAGLDDLSQAVASGSGQQQVAQAQDQVQRQQQMQQHLLDRDSSQEGKKASVKAQLATPAAALSQLEESP